MLEINTTIIEEAVYKLCEKANICYDMVLYKKLYDKYNLTLDLKYKNKLAAILKNAQLANDSNRPLCQDTGQVIVFIEVGQDVCFKGDLLSTAINNGIEKAYKENYYRKSVVKNALFERENTKTNTPAIIYTEIVPGKTLSVKLLIKGAGSENYSAIRMFNPGASKADIFEFIKCSVKTAGEKSCPPMVLGIGVGLTMDGAAVLSKKAFFNDQNSNTEKLFIEELKDYLSDFDENILDIKMLTASTHIACLPVALTINCHSTRHSSCAISEKGIEYQNSFTNFKEINEPDENLAEIASSDIETLKKLKKGDRILLTGEIYTARDAAHKKIKEFYDLNGALPFNLRDKIIFYAGPCPNTPNEICGPVGPTTSSRMDSYCEFMHSVGLFASIGKGERSKEAEDSIYRYGGKYLTAQGGVACLLAQCIKKSELIAFEELGTEAVRKLYVEKMPLTVEI